MKRSFGRNGLVTSAALVALTISVGLPASVAGASSPRPTAPRSVHASAQTDAAHISWSAPASSGSSAVKSYVVTSHPSSRSCTTPARSCVVKGLTAGSSYSFTVVAKNASGASPNSTSSNKVTIALSVKTAGVDYLAATIAWETSLSAAGAALSALTSTSTQAQVDAALASLKASYTTYTATLAKDKWPAAAQGDITAFIAEMTTTENDTLALSGAASASGVPLYYATLDADGNIVTVGDAKIRADLNLPQLINGPATSTSTPVAIGSPQIVHDFYGNTMSVTVSQIIDPATAGTGSGLPDPGYRFVAIQASLSNSDPANGEVDGNANLGMTVTGSDGVTYKADFGTASQCTNFNYGEFRVPVGDTSTGCVLFQLPAAITVKSVQFTLDAGYLDMVAWT